MTIHYYITPEVFAAFPEYRRGVVFAHGILNRPSPPELVAALRAQEAALPARLDLAKLAEHPRFVSWRTAYRQSGVKPAEFRPSMEALARRVLHGDPLPSINTLVDIGTLVSLRYLTPVGAHATDMLQHDFGLRRATGAELFEPFGADLVEHPNPGEIIFAEGDTVLTRRWTWRQAKHTLVGPETSAVEFNIDALPPVGEPEVAEICDLVAALVSQYCGGQTSRAILGPDNPRVPVPGREG